MESEVVHVVVIPMPAQGHITPALQVAMKLVALGFRVTFVNTAHNHELMLKSRGSKPLQPELKGIEFRAVPDGLPDNHPRLKKWNEFSLAILAMGPAFEEFFLDLMQSAPITCVIRDIRFVAVHGSATKLGIPVVTIAACPAIALQCALNVPMLLETGVLPLPPPPANIKPSVHPVAMTLGPPRSAQEAIARQLPLLGVVPGASPTMRVEDIPTHFLTHELVKHWSSNPLLPDCNALLLNSFHDLEGDVLDAMAEDLHHPVFAIGPLVLNSRTSNTDFGEGVEEVVVTGAGGVYQEEDPVALPWLDGQNPKSVLYVSFGSEAKASMEQMAEFAQGIEMSGHAFLWVIRSDMRKVLEAPKENHVRLDFEFSAFVRRTQHRGLVVSWAPQSEILSHPAVGAFLTHCGWNSALESIATGVPMLGWPRFADHTTICHYITQVWKIGLTFYPSHESAEDGSMIISKEEVVQKVRKMMTMVAGEEINVNSGMFKMAARRAVARGGSSHAALMKFVALVESWRIKQHQPRS